MSRYIDADALMKRVEDSNKSAGLHLEDLRKIRRWIKTAPSIDIVRCKECIYYSDGECKCGLLPFSEYSDTANLWVAPKPDDFCSYGEREGD